MSKPSFTYSQCDGPLFHQRSYSDTYVGSFNHNDFCGYDVWYCHETKQMKVAEKDGYDPADIIGLLARMLYGDKPHATMCFGLSMIIDFLNMRVSDGH